MPEHQRRRLSVLIAAVQLIPLQDFYQEREQGKKAAMYRVSCHWRKIMKISSGLFIAMLVAAGFAYSQSSSDSTTGADTSRSNSSIRSNSGSSGTGTSAPASGSVSGSSGSSRS